MSFPRIIVVESGFGLWDLQ